MIVSVAAVGAELAVWAKASVISTGRRLRARRKPRRFYQGSYEKRGIYSRGARESNGARKQRRATCRPRLSRGRLARPEGALSRETGESSRPAPRLRGCA